MEIRQLRYFVRLSETLHFGNAAKQEFISQPALSQQISRFEKEVGVRLFERSTHQVALTEAGVLLLSRAIDILARVDLARDEVRLLSEGLQGTLRVGQFAEGAGELTREILQTFRKLYPQVRLSWQEVPMGCQAESIVNGDVDVAFLRAPFGDERLRLQPLFEEPRVVVVASTDELADADRLTVDDLSARRFVAYPDSLPMKWRSFWTCSDDVGGGIEGPLALANSVAEGLAAVAYFGAVDTVPATTARVYHFPGVSYVPLDGAAFSISAIAARADDERPLVSAFEAIAVTMASQGYSLIPGSRAPRAAS